MGLIRPSVPYEQGLLPLFWLITALLCLGTPTGLSILVDPRLCEPCEEAMKNTDVADYLARGGKGVTCDTSCLDEKDILNCNALELVRTKTGSWCAASAKVAVTAV